MAALHSLRAAAPLDLRAMNALHHVRRITLSQTSPSSAGARSASASARLSKDPSPSPASVLPRPFRGLEPSLLLTCDFVRCVVQGLRTC